MNDHSTREVIQAAAAEPLINPRRPPVVHPVRPSFPFFVDTESIWRQATGVDAGGWFWTFFRAVWLEVPNNRANVEGPKASHPIRFIDSHPSQSPSPRVLHPWFSTSPVPRRFSRIRLLSLASPIKTMVTTFFQSISGAKNLTALCLLWTVRPPHVSLSHFKLSHPNIGTFDES